ncbi:MAG: hypothetical protein EOP48_11650 [Sphingobacteriales bacterium]|nr:MAG: hypothetical protein EOP48_11650 [Sphingobacteriales bacterium]
MKTLIIVVFFFVTLSSCGQTVTNDKPQTSGKPSSQDVSAVYHGITSEICNCISNTMRNNKPSTTSDSCFRATVNKYMDTLKVLGYDPASPTGQDKLLNETRPSQCPDLYSLMQKEWAGSGEKKLLFKGAIVSQKQLPDGEIEIVMADIKTKAKKTFKSKAFLGDPMETNKNTLNYEMTVEYEARKNPKTKQNEYYIKESGQVMSVGTSKVSDQ